MQRIVFDFQQDKAGWLIQGKVKPCSSKKKLMAYIKTQFDKHTKGVHKGRIIFELEEGG